MADLKSLLFKGGWLPGDLAKEMGVSRSLVTEVVAGRAAPSDRFAELAAGILGVTPDEVREAAPRRKVNRKTGDRILRTRARQACMLHGITGQELADRSRLSLGYVSKILRDTAPPTEAVTVAIEELTGIGRRELFPLFYGFDGDRGEF